MSSILGIRQKGRCVHLSTNTEYGTLQQTDILPLQICSQVSLQFTWAPYVRGFHVTQIFVAKGPTKLANSFKKWFNDFFTITLLVLPTTYAARSSSGTQLGFTGGCVWLCLHHRSTVLRHILGHIHRGKPLIISQKTGSELIWFKTFNNLYLFQLEEYDLKKTMPSYSLFQSLLKQVQCVDNIFPHVLFQQIFYDAEQAIKILKLQENKIHSIIRSFDNKYK